MKFFNIGALTTGSVFCLLLVTTAALAFGGDNEITLTPAGLYETGFQHGWLERQRKAEANRAARDAGRPVPPEDEVYGFAVTGTLSIPALLVTFDGDAPPPHPRANIHAVVFGANPDAVPAYYNEVSYGNLAVDAQTFGWRRLPESSHYYTKGSAGLENNSRKFKFVEDAVDLYDTVVDYGLFDNDGPDNVPNSGDDDGYVDCLMLIHQREGAESSGDSTSFWSQQHTHPGNGGAWIGGYRTDDSRFGGGKIEIRDFTIVGAVTGSGAIEGPRTYAHEIGHALGLPDLYDRQTGGSDCLGDGSRGIGGWGLMGSGWVHMSAWSKWRLGWLGLSDVVSNLVEFPLESATTTPTALRLFRGGVESEEFFIAELRSAVGFDAGLPGSGVLIWHVDMQRLEYAGAYQNANECHPLLDLEPANQTAADHTLDHDDLADRTASRSTYHMWQPGQTFGPASTPSSVTYSGASSLVTVAVLDTLSATRYSISASVGIKSTDVDLVVRDCYGDTGVEPNGCTTWWESPDIYIDNDFDGVQDAPATGGTTNNFVVAVRNLGSEIPTSVTVDLYWSPPGVGSRVPDDATLLGRRVLPVLNATLGGFQNAYIQATLPVETGIAAGDWTLAALVYNDEDPINFLDYPFFPSLRFDHPRLENNIAIRSRQEFWSAVGSPVKVDALVDDFTDTKFIVVRNRTDEVQELEMVFGHPPTYDDLVVPPEWQYYMSPITFSLATGDSQIVNVAVVKANPKDDDFIQLPITVLRVPSGEVYGGDYMEWRLDTVAPRDPANMRAIYQREPPAGGPGSDKTAISQKPIRVTWFQPPNDILGGAEGISHWEISVELDTVTTVPGDSLNIFFVGMDQDQSNAEMTAFLPAPGFPDSTRYHVVAVDRAGNRSGATTAWLQLPTGGGGLSDAPAPVPSARIVSINPNPFNPRTSIKFDLEAAGQVTVAVYDVRGRLVRMILDQFKQPGHHTVLWDGTDTAGQEVASGVYFARLQAGSLNQFEKMTLIR